MPWFVRVSSLNLVTPDTLRETVQLELLRRGQCGPVLYWFSQPTRKSGSVLRATVLSALGVALLSRRVPQALLGSVHGQAGCPAPALLGCSHAVYTRSSVPLNGLSPFCCNTLLILSNA